MQNYIRLFITCDCIQPLVDIVAKSRHHSRRGVRIAAGCSQPRYVTVQMGCAFVIVAMAQTTNRETRSTVFTFTPRDVVTRRARRSLCTARNRANTRRRGSSTPQSAGNFVPRPFSKLKPDPTLLQGAPGVPATSPHAPYARTIGTFGLQRMQPGDKVCEAPLPTGSHKRRRCHLSL